MVKLNNISLIIIKNVQQFDNFLHYSRKKTWTPTHYRSRELQRLHSQQQGNEEGEIPKTTQLNLSILLVVELIEFKTLWNVGFDKFVILWALLKIQHCYTWSYSFPYVKKKNTDEHIMQISRFVAGHLQCSSYTWLINKKVVK